MTLALPKMTLDITSLLFNFTNSKQAQSADAQTGHAEMCRLRHKIEMPCRDITILHLPRLHIV